MPNFSSSFFVSEMEDSANRFSLLDTTDEAGHVADQTEPLPSSPSSLINGPGSPRYASSPHQRHKTKPRNQQNLKILNINFRSAVNKVPAIQAVIDTHKPDIIIGSETWLKADIGDSEIFDEDYVVYRKDRQGRVGGGVLVAVRNSLKSERDFTMDTPGENVWAKVALANGKVLRIGAYYRPEMGCNESMDHLENLFYRINSQVASPTILGGDFNLPGITWDPSPEVRSDCAYRELHHQFLQQLEDHALTQTVKDPTRGPNTLDLFITNRPEIFSSVSIIPGLSDHDIPVGELDVQPVKHYQKSRKIPIYKKADWEGFAEDLSPLGDQLEDLAQTEDVNSLWSKFKLAVQGGIDKWIPHRVAKRRDGAPWISASTKKLIARRVRLFKAQRKSFSPERAEKLKALKSSIQREIRREHWTYLNSMFTGEEEGNAVGLKRFWCYIKHKKGGGGGVAPLQCDGETTADPKKKGQPAQPTVLLSFLWETATLPAAVVIRILRQKQRVHQHARFACN